MTRLAIAREIALDFAGVMVRIILMVEPPDRPHPQIAELEQKIDWFIEHPEFDHCVVVEPESQSTIRFYIPRKSKRGFRLPSLGRVMEVELTPDEAIDGEALMLKMGFESLTQRKGNFEGERNRVFPQFTKATKHAGDATRNVVKIMENVFRVGHAWLWTFHKNDPDQWPDPLPKPRVWPPT